MKTIRFGIAAALGCALAFAPAVFAQTPDRGAVPEKHDSNTLHKLGKAIQYPVRKAGENVSKSSHKAAKATQYVARKTTENASVSAHQATGQKSIIRRREKHVNRIVTPKGQLLTMHGKTMTQAHRAMMHHRRHHRYHRHHRMHHKK